MGVVAPRTVVERREKPCASEVGHERIQVEPVDALEGIRATHGVEDDVVDISSRSRDGALIAKRGVGQRIGGRQPGPRRLGLLLARQRGRRSRRREDTARRS